MSEIKNALISLGISEEEIRIYFYLLEHGAKTILQLSQQTNIPRTSVYVAVEALCTRELIVLENKDGKKIYAAADPQVILKYGQKKREHLVSALEVVDEEVETLRALYSKHAGKPVIRYAEGVTAVVDLLTQGIKEKECFLYKTTGTEEKHIGDVYRRWQTYISEKQISVKALLVSSNKKPATSFLFEFRPLPARFAGSTDVIIAGSTVTHVIFKEQSVYAVQTTDVALAADEKKRFEMLWNLLDMLHQFAS